MMCNMMCKLQADLCIGEQFYVIWTKKWQVD